MSDYTTSREADDYRETNLLRDVAFNRHSMNDGHHISPFDNGVIQVGCDGIKVELTQGIDEENFKRTLSRAQRATIGIDLNKTDDDFGDWEEMLQGGLQTALETQVVVFTVQGVSRTCTHQLVRSRRASFHQQSQRASWYGDKPEVRMPESIWRNDRARAAYLRAVEAAHDAYRVACDEDISYQDARYALGESTTNFIMCEYSIREFINVFAYRGCSMFSWEIVHVAREMRRLLVEAHPWLEPYIKISCEKSGKCTFQGWEQVEGQCDRPEAREDNRTFRSKRHEIARTERGSFKKIQEGTA
jgi:thymidylate synthase (FAD)